jgi:hypothetical protein
MATFGGYETVHEIYRHGLGSVSRAKVANPTEGTNGEPDYVVKAFQPPYRIAGQEAIKPAVRSFLDRARVQQDVVTAGARHWAPIYEAGAARDGAYYVTAYYGRTALKLISGRVKLTSQSLYIIIRSVLRGLAELKQHSGQPHGNLKPTNVLVVGEGEIDEGKIFLTDPASREQLPAADGEGADLASVGELLYQLVLHRPFRGSQSYPIMESPEWARLGKKGEAWRQFCNQLLNPAGSLRIDGALERVESFRDKKRIFSGRGVRTAAVVVLVAVVAFVGWRYARFRSDWKELCLKYDDWYYRLDNDLRADPARLSRLKGDAYLGGALGELQNGGAELDPKKIAGNELLVMSSLAERPPLSVSAVGQTSTALGTLKRFESAISPGQWPFLRELAERQNVYEQRHWNSAAAYLHQLVDGVNPQSHGDLAVQLDRLTTGGDKLKRDLAFIEDRWQVITSTDKTIKGKAAGDKVLGGFDAFARRYVEGALAGPAPTDLDEVRVAVVPVADLAGKLNEVLQSEWSDKIDRDRFAHEGEIYRKPAGSPGAADFTAWLGEVQDFYRYKLDARSEPLSQLAKMTDQVRGDIKSLRTDVPNEPPDVLNRFDQRLATTAASVDKLRDKAWVQKDRRTDVISRAGNELQVALKNLRDEVSTERLKHTIDQKKWWDDSGKAIADSAAVNSAWTDWRKRLGVEAGKLPLPPSEFQDVRTRAEQWTKELRDVEKQFPPAPSQIGSFDALVKAKREEKLSEALSMAGPAGKQPDLAVLRRETARTGADYAAWCTDLAALLADADRAAKSLDSALTPGDSEWGDLAKFKDKWASREVWRDVATQPPVAGVAARLDALGGIAGMPRSALAERAGGRESLPVEWLRAAWQALGRAESPAWPATSDELVREIAVRRNLAARIEGIGDAFRKKKLRDEMARQGPVRLASYVNSVAAAPGTTAQFDANIRSAEAALEPMGVTTPGAGAATTFERYRRLASLDGVDPTAKANALLCGLKAASANTTMTQDQLGSIVEEFKQDTSRLPADTRARVSGVIEGFAKLAGPETAAGPPAPSWVSKDVNGRLIFSNATDTLEFVRVQIPGKLPTYICTTELSVSTFLAAVPQGEWVQSGGGLLIEFPPGRDPRPGPRVWEWNEQGGGPIRPSEYWLRPRNDDVYDYFLKDPQYRFNHRKLDASVGGDPLNRPKLPMQYLPAHTAMYVASLLGCRVPTSEEWNAAWKINGDAGKGGTMNLRDKTWQRQWVWAAKYQNILEWPDAGAFWPKGYTGARKTGLSALPYQTDDGVLWFREVDSDDKQLFHNLIGNVWEYLWEDPATLESMSDKSLRGWKLLLDSRPNQVFVIGGSALSAPEITDTAPHPVELTHSAASGSVDGLVGFADVGMRLAFTARPKLPSERLKWLTASQQYVGATDAPATRPAR